MHQFKKSRRFQRRGALTLEWVLLVTVIVIGIIGGLGAVRNATNGELIDLAEAIEAINVLPEPMPLAAGQDEHDH
jgi:Flp pilus assembly pilin Flp